MKGRHPWVRVALLAALAYASTAGVAGAQEGVAFDLPEQSLEESLRALGKSSNINILIDRSLVSGIDSSHRAAAITRAIIGLCESLDLDITAEGIERPTQLPMLLGSRRMHLQGYLLSRPIAARDLP